MICHSNALPSAQVMATDGAHADSRVSLLVGNVQTKAAVIEWTPERAVLLVDDPSHTVREGLFVAQLMNWIGRDQRITGTLQSMQPSSTGKFRLQVLWHRSILNRLTPDRSEFPPTLCAC